MATVIAMTLESVNATRIGKSLMIAAFVCFLSFFFLHVYFFFFGGLAYDNHVDLREITEGYHIAETITADEEWMYFLMNVPPRTTFLSCTVYVSVTPPTTEPRDCQKKLIFLARGTAHSPLNLLLCFISEAKIIQPASLTLSLERSPAPEG